MKTRGKEKSFPLLNLKHFTRKLTMNQEQKYKIITEYTGALFLHSNDRTRPAYKVTAKEPCIITETEKTLYSNDIKAYGPKLMIIPVDVKEVKAKTDTSKAEKQTEVKAKSSDVEKQKEVKKEIENKLETAPKPSKDEIKAKVKKLKIKYSEEQNKDVRKQIKKEIETLLNT
jgi:hypothetical protein